MGRYKKEYYCVGCNKALSWNQVMGSHGCCPLCGKLTPGTICGSYEKASETHTAWTFFKLNVVRALLRPILRWHVEYEAKRNKQSGD